MNNPTLSCGSIDWTSLDAAGRRWKRMVKRRWGKGKAPQGQVKRCVRLLWSLGAACLNRAGHAVELTPVRAAMKPVSPL